VVEPSCDRRGFTGKSRFELTAIAFLRMRDPELESGQAHDVVGIGALGEAQLAIGQPRQRATELTLRTRLRSDTGDIVNAGREHPIAAREHLCESARLRVLLQHEHALAVMRQRGGGAQAADARADDDRVPVGHRDHPSRSPAVPATRPRAGYARGAAHRSFSGSG
jgi:hypothetical protein